MTTATLSRPIRRGLTAVGILGSRHVSSGPIRRRRANARPTRSSPTARARRRAATKPKGVTDNVLTRIDLVNEPVMFKDHALRLRRLVVKPGGIVPWHSHTDRPAIIYIISGTITEYRSTCTDADRAQAGESTAEVKGTSHWWKNTGKKTVVLLSADLFHDKDDPHVM